MKLFPDFVCSAFRKNPEALKKQLSDAQKSMLALFTTQKKFLREVAKLIGCATSTVVLWKKRFLEGENLLSKEWKNHKLTNLERRDVVSKAKH
jgi:transposase